MAMKNPFAKKKNPYNDSDCTAVFIDEVGAITLRVFRIIDRKEGMALISFDFPNNKELYKIKERFIRRKRVLIYKTKEGKIIVQDPDKWRDIDFKSYDIKTLPFNLQNFSLQESKAANHRWVLPDTLMSKLSPLFKLLLIGIAVGVLGWALFKFAGVVLDRVLASRLLPCSQVLPQLPSLGNFTHPIG